MGWYPEVARDVRKPEAIKFFESELQDARLEVKLKGSVEKQDSMPGIVEHRFNQLQEIEAIQII